MSTCLTEEELLALVDGRLPEADRLAAEQHLDACAPCRKVVAGLLAASASGGVQVPSPLPPEKAWEGGGKVGRYAVLRPIGSGAMGVIYLAYDPTLSRNVALKLLRPSAVGGSEQARARVQQEAQAMARVAHPNVVAIHDVGTVGDQVFIAMEFVPGLTLRDWVQAERRSPSEVLQVLVGAGQGLSAAHRAGLVHRDFKPENVLVGPDGRARVTDFGLARLAPEEAPPAAGVLAPPPGPGPAMGASSLRAGSPAYMAPETLRGQVPSERADIFSFCVTAFEMLYGERPFLGESVAALVGQIERGQPRPRSPGARLPAQVRRALQEGLSADPSRRPPSMEALLARLAPAPSLARRYLPLAVAGLGLLLSGRAWVLAHRPRCSGGPPRWAQVWNAERRGRLEQAFRGTGLPFAEDAIRSVEAHLDDWGGQWTAAYREACEATQVRAEQSAELLDLRMACLDQRLQEAGALVELLEHADARLAQRATGAVAALPVLSVCADAAGLRARGGPPAGHEPEVLAARAQLAEAKARLATGQYEAARSLSEQAQKQAQAAAFGALQAEAWFVLGRSQDHLSAYAEAEHSLQAASLLAGLGTDPRLMGQALCQLIYVAGNDLDHVEDARRWYELAQPALAKAVWPEPVVESCEQHLGSVLAQHDRLPEALPHLQKAVDLAVAAEGPDSLAACGPSEALAVGLFLANRPQEALVLLQRVLATSSRELGREHPRVAMTEANVGSTLDKLGQTEQAVKLLSHAQSVLVTHLGPDNGDVLASGADLARALRHQGSQAQAQAQAERCVHSCQVSKSCEGRTEAEALQELGSDLLAQQKPQAALQPLERALELGVHAQVAAEDLAETRYALAQALWEAQGPSARAVELAQAARATWAGLVPPRSGPVDGWLAAHPRPR